MSLTPISCPQSRGKPLCLEGRVKRCKHHSTEEGVFVRGDNLKGCRQPYSTVKKQRKREGRGDRERGMEAGEENKRTKGQTLTPSRPLSGVPHSCLGPSYRGQTSPVKADKLSTNSPSNRTVTLMSKYLTATWTTGENWRKGAKLGKFCESVLTSEP